MLRMRLGLGRRPHYSWALKRSLRLRLWLRLRLTLRRRLVLQQGL